MSAQVSTREPKLLVLNNESLSTYVDVVHFFSAMYADDNVIDRMAKYLECYRQSAGMIPTKVSKSLFRNVVLCSLIYDNNRVKLLFVERMEDVVCQNIHLYRNRNPIEHLTQLV